MGHYQRVLGGPEEWQDLFCFNTRPRGSRQEGREGLESGDALGAQETDPERPAEGSALGG